MIKKMILDVPQKIVAYNGNPAGQHVYGEQRQQIAEMLYDKGYRKVPFGAVILTPEERDEEMKAYNDERAEFEAEIERLKAQLAEFEKPVIQFVKDRETQAVKEFAEKLKKVIHERDYVQGYAEIGLIEEIDELLKEYEEWKAKK